MPPVRLRVALLAALALPACVDVEGGAVEVAWKVFGPGGRSECPDNPSRCEAGRVARVAVEATRVDAPEGEAATPVRREFECDAGTGSTLFNLPAGRYSVRLVVTTAGDCGGMPCRATVPPPLVADVEHGKVSQMKLLQIVAENSPDCR